MSLLLNAAAGYFKGQNVRRERQDAQDQEAQQRQDALARQSATERDHRQQMALQQRRLDLEDQRYSDQQGIAAENQARDDYNSGFGAVVPAQQAGQRRVASALDSVSRGVADIGAVPDQAGLNQGAAAMNTPTAFTRGGINYGKVRPSVHEQDRDAAAQDRLLQAAADAKARAQQAGDAQTFQHGENEANRANQLRAANIAASGRLAGAQQHAPTQGELQAGSLLPEIRGARDYLNKYDNPGALQTLAKRGGMLTNWANTEEGQAYNQAAVQYIRNTIYAKSGKAVTESEAKELYGIYIPVPGDKPQVLERKRQARALNEQGVGIAAGRALGRVDGLPDVTGQAATTPAPMGAAAQGVMTPVKKPLGSYYR